MTTQRGWAVYRHLGADAGMGVCRAAEWPGLDAERPGALALVESGIPSEGLAERLARGTAGDPVPRARPARPSHLPPGGRPPTEATAARPAPSAAAVH